MEWISVEERLPEPGEIVLVRQVYSWQRFEDGVEVTIGRLRPLDALARAAKGGHAMKFKDKDGNVFEGIVKAHINFCRGKWCHECVMNRPGGLQDCVDFAKAHPAEAARLMGYEVVEDKCDTCANENPSIECVNCGSKHWNYRPQEKEANMDNQKPRICEVLGVEVGQTFTAKTPFGNFNRCEISEDGMALNMGTNILCYIINNPDGIIRWPRFTEEEVSDARIVSDMLPAAYRVERYLDNTVGVYSRLEFITNINNSKFPSIRPGTSVDLNEIVGATE